VQQFHQDKGHVDSLNYIVALDDPCFVQFYTRGKGKASTKKHYVALNPGEFVEFPSSTIHAGITFMLVHIYFLNLKIYY
jgi:mannose-6-phosphate isomerase class I